MAEVCNWQSKGKKYKPIWKKIKVYEYFGHLATDEMIIMNLKQMLRVFGQEHGLVAGTEIWPWIP